MPRRVGSGPRPGVRWSGAAERCGGAPGGHPAYMNRAMWHMGRKLDKPQKSRPELPE